MNLERAERKIPPTERQKQIFRYLDEHGASSANKFRHLIEEPDFNEQLRALLNILAQSARDGYIEGNQPPSRGVTKWKLTQRGKIWV